MENVALVHTALAIQSKLQQLPSERPFLILALLLFLDALSFPLMARKQRKLFPAVAATNQTVDCEPYSCEPFPDYYYFQPPPPPPPPLSAAHHSSSIGHISPYLIISFSFLAGVLVLVCYFVVIARSCPSWCSRRNNGPAPSLSDGTDQEFLDEAQVDHPVWFITTVGLQQSIISSIAVCKYKKGEGLIEGTECSVCLNEFQEGETLRLLPKCSHAFHIPCIDTWLRSHTNCPLCRANIVTDTVNLDIVRHPLAPVDQNANNLNINDGIHVRDTGTEADLRDYQIRNREMSENRDRTAVEGELLVVDGERISKERVNCSEDRSFREDSTYNDQDVNNDIQGTNSIPVDSSPDLRKFGAAQSEGSWINQTEDAKGSHLDYLSKQEDRRMRLHRLMTTYSSIEECLHIRPMSMKRSFSSGGRISSSRRNWSQSSIQSL